MPKTLSSMKVSLSVLAIATQLVRIVCSEEENICIGDQCYPKNFEPDKEWKPVQEGQIIPPGSHVRMDFNTHQREAKLVDENDDIDSSLMGVAVVDATDTFADDHSLEKIIGLSVSQLDEKLEELVELSHDYEYGSDIILNDQYIIGVAGLVPTKTQFASELKEKALRIVGSCLRNNADAVEKLLGTVPNTITIEFISNLVGKVNTTEENVDPVEQKRILSIIGAIIPFNIGKVLFEACFGTQKLLLSLDKLDDSVQLKAYQVLDDFIHHPQEELLSSLTEKERLVKHIELIQSFFASGKHSLHEAINRELFSRLVALRSDLESTSTNLCTPSTDFLNWLIDEIEATKEVNPHFSQELKHLRFEFFGNPLASRKGFSDEL
ncbi:BA75_01302T0 [Komagataella pastoris]|uniref:Nucleotide exchange factor SIL1 n=1 Tax=Komagataella pastoris TaxID=4922 RepID=A0A1B2J5A3_PICPA|nr:BA75_01302T0 [Komagataella pastoris]